MCGSWRAASRDRRQYAVGSKIADG